MTSKLIRTYSIKRFIKQFELCLKSPFANYCTSHKSLVPVSKKTNLQSEKEDDPLAVCEEDVSHYASNLLPTFNIAAYANKSHTIQQLVKLGVNLHKIEKKGLAEFILRLDFERDVKKYIQFLHDVGVPPVEYGHFFTVNPHILKEDLDDLVVRLNYLESKKFLSSDIVRILSKNPKWISYSTKDIDHRLGFFQNQFSLSGDEVRHVAIKMPKLITYSLQHVEEIKFTVKEEMGFSKVESKQLLLQKPKIFTLNRLAVQQRLDFILNTMKIPHEQIVTQSSAVVARLEKLRHRHDFLVLLKKNQYDCHLPGYISLKRLVEGIT
ncbi:mitochondrial transcription termination factor 3 isoform X2 [Rhodnius prolixus]|uniref:mitochondrial transcription termination factor 3 isoform X2 n=1 Tax=Rhodnius prolixus TaxID=13249 RepID=UPI003D189289